MTYYEVSVFAYVEIGDEQGVIHWSSSTICGLPQLSDYHLQICTEGKILATEEQKIYFQHLTKVISGGHRVYYYRLTTVINPVYL